MALGTNRDYKTTERRAISNLRRHAILMDQLKAKGMSREEASAEALRIMEAEAKQKGRAKP